MHRLCIIFLVLACCKGPIENRPIRVAVAANAQVALKEIIQSYSEISGEKFEISTGSSGKLSTQIMNGAPYDIFISADEDYPQTLFNKEFLRSEPRVYAKGVLILWSSRKGILPTTDHLDSKEIVSIAIANPKNAPYGKAAIEFIEHIQGEKSLVPKLVYGESIAQTNQFILSGAADIGISSKSSVYSLKKEDRAFWREIDPSLYTPIRQSAGIVVQKGQNLESVSKFYDYLFSDSSKFIFQKFGYLIE